METLEELQKRARESLASQRGLVSSLANAEFGDDEVADEMKRLQAQDARKQAMDQKNQADQSAKAEADRASNLDRQYQNKQMGLGNKFDPKLLDYASTIFPSLKEMGLSSNIQAPLAPAEPSRSVAQEVPEEETPDIKEESPEKSQYDLIKGSILKTEAGFSNNPKDKGGPTNRGVTLDTYSSYLGRPATIEELKNIPEEHVDKIFNRYYNEIGGDNITDPRVRELLTDQNYNKGTTFLNRINDMLGTPRGTALSPEAIDKINNMNPDELLKQVLTSERNIYKRIAEKDPDQREFSNGWDKRILDQARKFGITLSDEESPQRSPSNVQELLDLQNQKKEDEKLISEVQQNQSDIRYAKRLARFRDAAMGAGLGKNIEGDYSMYDELSEAAEAPVQKIKALQELNNSRAKNDPNSSISKLMRNSLKELGMKMEGLDNVSYAQIEKLYPSLANAAMTKVASDARKEDKKMTQMVNQERLADKKKADEQAAYERTRTIVNNKIGKLQESKNAPFKGYQDAKATLNSLENAITAWDNEDESAKIPISESFMKYAKLAQGDDSVVRSSDMQALAGGLNFTNPKELWNKFIAKGMGASFTKAELIEMKNIISAYKKFKKQDLQQRLNPIKLDAERGGYDLDQSISPDIMEEIYAEEPKSKLEILAERAKKQQELLKKQGK